MKTFTKILFVSFLLIFVQSCSKIFKCKDDELTIPRTENNTNKLKLDGYYYNIYSFDTSSAEVYLLYQNGIFFNAVSKDLADIKNNTIDLYLPDLAYQYKGFWGTYKIDSNNIEIEYWLPQANHCVKLSYNKGEILNDTTFKITYVRTSYRGEVGYEKNVNDIFYFKQYSPKPDSTISFIP
jgi:hypothetical protein